MTLRRSKRERREKRVRVRRENMCILLGERAGGGPWPLGSTVLRNQLLRAWGWTVVTVTYLEWERAGTAEAKRAYVGRLLDAAAQRRR